MYFIFDLQCIYRENTIFCDCFKFIFVFEVDEKDADGARHLVLFAGQIPRVDLPRPQLHPADVIPPFLCFIGLLKRSQRLPALSFPRPLPVLPLQEHRHRLLHLQDHHPIFVFASKCSTPSSSISPSSISPSSTSTSTSTAKARFHR